MLCTNADTNRKTRKIFVPQPSNFCTASCFLYRFSSKYDFFVEERKDYLL